MTGVTTLAIAEQQSKLNSTVSIRLVPTLIVHIFDGSDFQMKSKVRDAFGTFLLKLKEAIIGISSANETLQQECVRKFDAFRGPGVAGLFHEFPGSGP